MNLKFKSTYTLKEFSLNCLFAFLVFSFMFSLRAFLNIFEIFIRGTFNPLTVSILFFLIFITTFTYIVPLTLLYGSLAAFARMSVDRELVIMSSSGINPVKLMKPVFTIALLTSILLIYFNLFILPSAVFQRRNIISSLRVRNPLTLIQEGDLITDIPGITIYAEKKHRDFTVENIAITYTEEGLTNFLKAETGKIKFDRQNNMLVFNLEKGNIIRYEPPKTISTLSFTAYTFNYPLSQGFRQRAAVPRISEMHLKTLLEEKNLEENMEIHKRIIFGITPLFFVFLGAGMGKKIKQKSKLLHVGLGGVTGLLFFQLIVLGELIARKTFFTPSLWLPVPVIAILSFILWKKQC